MPPKKASNGVVSADGESKSAVAFPLGTLARTAETRLQKTLSPTGLVAGVDEAGRGPLAGPVVAAACILPADVVLPGVNDSKKLDEQQREALFAKLTGDPRVSYAVSVTDHRKIDEVNILQATMLSMAEAVKKLSPQPEGVLVDGNRIPPAIDAGYKAQAIIQGDGKEYCIAAASILAKVTRDRIMVELSKQYPAYGFEEHKGYGVPAHVAAIFKHGPSPVHRKTFNPVKSMLAAAAAAEPKKDKEKDMVGGAKAEAATEDVTEPAGKSRSRKAPVAKAAAAPTAAAAAVYAADVPAKASVKARKAPAIGSKRKSPDASATIAAVPASAGEVKQGEAQPQPKRGRKVAGAASERAKADGKQAAKRGQQ